MARVPYSEQQIVLIVDRLGPALGRADVDRLQLLAPLFRGATRASVADCQQLLFPDKAGKPAVDAFKALRNRVEQAARDASPPIDLRFGASGNKKLGAAKRDCWLEGPDLLSVEFDQRNQRVAGDVERLPLVESPARWLQPPLIRFFPIWHNDQHTLGLKLLDLLLPELRACQTFRFEHVGDAADARLLLPLTSPAFFGDQRLLARVQSWALDKQACPVRLAPVAPDQTHPSWQAIQHYVWTTPSGQSRCFSECDAKDQAKFAHGLYEAIVAAVQSAHDRESWTTGLDWLGSWSARESRFDESRTAGNPAKELPLHATEAPQTAVRYDPDGDAVDLLVKWAADRDAAPYMAVLGEYGIGKTTSLRRFTLRMKQERDTNPAMPVAIYLDLRHGAPSTPVHATCEDILRHIIERDPPALDGPRPTPQSIIEAVRKRGAILIFDGLDERTVHMTAAEADAFIAQLWSVLPASELVAATDAGDRRGKLIIVCRSHYFRTLSAQRQMLTGRQRAGMLKDDFRALIVLPFGEAQIRDYIDKALQLGGQHADRVDAVLHLFGSIHNLRELSERPVLLAMLVELIDELEMLQARGGQALRAVDVYDRIVERWLERDGGKHKLDPDDKRRIMEQLAAHLWKAGVKEFDVEQLDRWFLTAIAGMPEVEARARLDGFKTDILAGDLHAGTFLVRPDHREKQFRFAHTSFQEYFLARYLLRALEDGKAELWDLPMPSLETLEFFGQILACGDSVVCHAVVGHASSVPGSKGTLEACPTWRATLNAILAGDCVRAATIAFRYWLLALEKHLPVPQPAHVALPGADLEEYTIRGPSPSQPLNLRGANLAGARLNRARLENVNLTGADLTGIEARQALFLNVQAAQTKAVGVDFAGLQWRGGSLAHCDLACGLLAGCQWIDIDLTAAVLPDGWMRQACAVNLARPRQLLPGAALHVANGHLGDFAAPACAFSPDGTRLVSGSVDNTVRVWDAVSGQCLLTLQGHQKWVTSCAWSPDGTRLVSGSADKTVKVWNAAGGQCMLTLQGHQKGVASCGWSPDGARLVSGSADKTVKVWNAAGGQCLLTLQGHQKGVTSCAWSSDGTRLASGSDDRTVKVWDATNGNCLLTLQGDHGAVTSCAFSPDGLLLVSGSADKTVKVWDAASGTCLLTLQGHQSVVTSCAFSPDGTRLVSGSWDSALMVWDAASGTCLLTLQGLQSGVTSCAFSPDGTQLVSGSSDNTVKVWDVADGKCLLTLQGYQIWLISCAWSPDGTRLVSGSDDNTVKVWDATGGDCLLTLQGHRNWVISCAFSPDGTRLVSGSEDNTVKLWDAASGKCLLTLQGHRNGVSSCAFGPDGMRLVSGSSDKTVKVWDAASGACLLSLQGHQSGVTSCAFSPDGTRLVSGSWDSTLMVWDAASGNCLVTLQGHKNWVMSCAFSPDGTRLVSGSNDNTMNVWDVAGGRCLRTIETHQEHVNACAWSRDSSRLLSASEDGTVKIWDAETGRLIVEGRHNLATACAWRPDGMQFVSASLDGSIKVWDAVNCTCLWTGYLFPDLQYATIHARKPGVAHASPEAWRYLGWRWFDPDLGRLRLLPAEFFGPLPV